MRITHGKKMYTTTREFDAAICKLFKVEPNDRYYYARWTDFFGQQIDNGISFEEIRETVDPHRYPEKKKIIDALIKKGFRNETPKIERITCKTMKRNEIVSLATDFPNDIVRLTADAILRGDTRILCEYIQKLNK